MALHIYPVTIRGVSPPIQCLLSRPTTEFRSLPTVIYYHGLNGTRNQIFQDRYKEMAEVIQSLNCNLLSIDLRCHGDRRENREIPAIDNMMKVLSTPEKNPFDGSLVDTKTIMQFLVEKSIAPAGEIAVMGLSWGGVHAMYAMQQERGIRCGVALLPVGRITSLVEFRPLKGKEIIQKYEPLNFITNIAPKPLLMITAEQDNRASPVFASELYEHLRPDYEEAGMPEHLAYRMLLGVRHTYDSKMGEFTRDWLKKYLITPAAEHSREHSEKPRGI